jgi:FkbM family methyltransferase
LVKIKTDRGTYWVPPGTEWPYVLAEQTIRIYGDGPYRVQRGNVVLDCGANIGAFTREALDAGAGLVVAIEPVPANVECLRRTFKAEIEQGRVRVVEKGVWNKDDTLVMNLFDNTALDSFVMTDRPEGQVSRRVSLPLTTIDAIVDELTIQQVDFIKMDIEGAERQALEGARRTIRSYKPHLSIATENLPDDYDVVPKVIADLEPSYQWVRGPCSFTDRFTVGPETLYFYSR